MATYEKCLLILLTIGFLNSINAQTKDHIRVSSVPEIPYLIEGPNGFTGFIPDLLDKLQYNYTISISPDGLYGYQHANGTWTGMVGELVNKNADLAGLMTVTNKRSEFVDFSYPVMSVGQSILMKKPARTSVSLPEQLSKLLYPFEVSVWLMSFIALLVTGTVLYIMMHFNPYEWRRMARDHEATIREGESFTCLNAFFFVASTLMWQGYVSAPRSIGSRILVVAWWAFTIIFIVSYTASLTNYLRVGPEHAAGQAYSIRSFRDLANSDDVRIGLLPMGATNRFFQNSNSSVYQQIYEKVIEDPVYGNLSSIGSLVEYMRNRSDADFAVIVESPTARYIANQKYCDTYVINEGFPNKHYAFGLQKNSLYTEELTSALLQLSETGELQELERKWFKSRCMDTVLLAAGEFELPAFHRLDLATFSTALVIVLAGMVLGGLVCIIEICIYKSAETNASDDEAERITTGHEASEKLLQPVEKKGGATPV